MMVPIVITGLAAQTVKESAMDAFRVEFEYRCTTVIKVEANNAEDAITLAKSRTGELPQVKFQYAFSDYELIGGSNWMPTRAVRLP
jgi:hypothetical protein